MYLNTPIAVHARHYARAFTRLLNAVRRKDAATAACLGISWAEVWERKGDVARRDHYYTEEIHLGTGEIRDAQANTGRNYCGQCGCPVSSATGYADYSNSQAVMVLCLDCDAAAGQPDHSGHHLRMATQAEIGKVQ